MSMSSSPDRELLSQGAARQLLERAGQIDAESTSVDTLRAAAREAGISEEAFETALMEMRGKVANHDRPKRKPAVQRIVVGMAVFFMALAVFVVIPRRVAPREFAAHEFIVQCLPMQTAADIARTTLGPDAAVSWRGGSRIMRIRATPDQMFQLDAALKAAMRQNPSCEK